MHNDTIIIGGGLGGLFTGALLAREGQQVIVLEQNSTPGGGLQNFHRWGKSFDSGMHVVTGLQPGGNIYRICSHLGIIDSLKIHQLHDVCDMVYVGQDKTHYLIRSGRQGLVDSLATYFPHMRQGLIDYVDAITRVVEEMDLYHLRPTCYTAHHSEEFDMPATDFIAKYISDPKLQRILLYLGTLYDAHDGLTPTYVHAVVNEVYMSGHGVMIGGSQQFADALIRVIQEAGGHIYTNSRVCHISTENGRITSVRTTDGSTWQGTNYVSTIHPATLLPMLDNERVFSKAYRMRINTAQGSSSALMLNIKFHPDTFPYLPQIGYYLSGHGTHAQWPAQFIYITPPAIEQGQWAHTMNVTVPMPWNFVKPWAHTTRPGHRGAEYMAWKQAQAQRVLDILEGMHPGLQQAIDKMDISSPLTFRDYYGTKEGAIYGIQKQSNNMLSSLFSVHTRVPNLFLGGQNVNLHGICGVPLTAIMTSEAILGSNQILSQLNQCSELSSPCS